MEEAVTSLFDACDELKSGKVPVSVLINAVKDEADDDSDVNKMCHEKGQVILEAIRGMLDPCGSDVVIDKATWVAAWKKQEETHTHKDGFFRGMGRYSADSDDLSCLNSSSNSPLNHNKQSYHYSPASHSSSVSEADDLVELEALRKENRQLLSSQRALRDQCLALEEALAQEQTERQEQEKRLEDNTVKWTKKYTDVHNLYQNLKVSFDVCEEEKLALGRLLSQRNEEEKWVKMELEKLKTENATLNATVKLGEDEFQRMNGNYESQIKSLTTEKAKLISYYEAQLLELQEILQKCVAEQRKTSSQETWTYQHKEIGECEPNNNLMSDLKFSDSELYLTPCNDNVESNNSVSLSEFNQIPVSKPCSIFEEMQAVTSSLPDDSTLDCSFDEEPDRLAYGDNQLVGVNQDLRGFVSGRDLNQAMNGEHCRGVLDHKSECLATISASTQSLEIKNEHMPTRIQMLDSETQTENQWESHLSSFYIPPKPHESLRITKADLETPFPVSCTTPLQKSSNFKILTKLIKSRLPSYMVPSTSKKSITQSTSTLVPSSFLYFPNWFRVLFFLTMNIVLLICGIIILTAALLEQAHEKGALNPPYRGAVAPWLKYLISPFVQTHHGYQNSRPL